MGCEVHTAAFRRTQQHTDCQLLQAAGWRQGIRLHGHRSSIRMCSNRMCTLPDQKGELHIIVVKELDSALEPLLF